MRQAVVLAGGLATRMLPRTEQVPKVLLPVAGRPFLALLLDRLAACGFTDALLLTGHLGDAVDAYLAAHPSPLRVATASDGATLLGTGGALKRAEARLADTFLLTYGDSYLTFDYGAPLDVLERDASALGCMAVYENRGELEPSNARVDGRWIAAYDKSRPAGERFDHIDYGATALRRGAVRALEGGVAVDLAPVLGALAKERLLLACVVEERFYEIGSPRGLRDLEAHLGGSPP